MKNSNLQEIFHYTQDHVYFFKVINLSLMLTILELKIYLMVIKFIKRFFCGKY
jgi:hypothetical protein